MNAIVITITADNQERLTQIAERLLQDRLAGCCQVLGPLTSIYRWNERIETASEWICLIKTRKAHFDRVAAVIRELHSYEVPEIIATEIQQASLEYLAWLFAETDV